MQRIIYFFSLLLLFSCNENKQNNEAIENEKWEHEFEKQLRDKPKLFLQFWEGMTYKEYKSVEKNLIKEKIISKFGYITKKCDAAPINPIFKNNKLVSIEIIGDTCLYSIYKEKYSLPPMQNRTYITGLFDKRTIHTEKALIHKRPLEYDKGEIIEKENVVIQIEHEEYIDFKKEHPYQDFYPGFGSSLGKLVFTYKGKEQFLKEEKERKEKIELHKSKIERKNIDNNKRIQEVNDEI